jgi:NAD-dependent dihydropyrimidine dehydrogenase PreA subunit
VRKDGIFIAVEVDDRVASDGALAAKLAEVCPVDIFVGTDKVEIVEGNLDECVLCRLCLDAVPDGVRVLKLYEDGAAL